MKKFFLSLILALPVWASAADALPAGVTQPAFFAKQGIKVISHKKGVGGLNVWHVERGSTKTVLYTTADNAVLLSGVLWDAASGANLSDAYITPEMTIAPEDKAMLSASAAPQQTSSQSGSPTKPSDAIKGVATLAGTTEGKAAIDKTLYIIYDPRCPYCQSVYQKTRQYVKNGGSIKWIPTTILGDKLSGAMLVADVLQSRNPTAKLGEIMKKNQVGSTTPNAATKKAIEENEAYFFAAFDKNKGAGTPGVPVAFFETKAGAPQMVSGIDDDALLARIYSDIKK